MHDVMYGIDCFRASAAPLASGSANKSVLLLSHKVLHRSNITHYYHRLKYIFTCSRRIVAWGQHVLVFRILNAPRKLKHVPLHATVL